MGSFVECFKAVEARANYSSLRVKSIEVKSEVQSSAFRLLSWQAS